MATVGHVIKDQGVETGVGLLALGVGFFLLWDAYTNRGEKAPLPIRLVVPAW